MLRCIWSALALACGAVQAFSAPPAPAETASSGPMRFEWRKEGPAELCAPRCRTWISAAGYITADTPREFDKFTNTSGDVRGAVLVLDSDGGSVLGTLALGRMIRNLDMVTTIGRTTALPDARGEPRAALAPEGTCESMCAFLLLAGTQRYVPPQAQVLVHQIWLGKKRKQALDLSYTAEELNIVQRDIGRLAQYTVEMGGGVELLETALRIPPWEPLYRLSGEEVLRMKLSTVETLFERQLPKTAPAVSTISIATVGHPASAPHD